MTQAPLRPVHLDARDIPVPRSISPLAQAFLGRARDRVIYPSSPEAWRLYAAKFNRDMAARFLPHSLPAKVERRVMEGVTVYVATPDQLERPDQPIVYLHGGGMVLLGGPVVEFHAALTAARFGHIAYAIDFRCPPEHPYPAGLDDCVAVCKALISADPTTAIYGLSGGGNLATAACIRMRDAGGPLPAALVLDSPQLDLTESGDSFSTNRDIDFVLQGSTAQMNRLYAGGHDLADPMVSPLFADFRPGFPPTCILSGTRDLFLSNAVRMHRNLRRAGVAAELHVWEAAPHGGFDASAPESVETRGEIKRFLMQQWARRATTRP